MASNLTADPIVRVGVVSLSIGFEPFVAQLFDDIAGAFV